MRLADARLTFPFESGPHGEPPEEYRKLREESPVTPVILPSGDRVWLVTGYADAKTVGLDPRFSRDVRAAGLKISTGRDFFVISESFMYMDPPEHTRLRRIVQPFFTQEFLGSLTPKVEEAAARWFAEFARLSPPADLAGRLAYPFTNQVTCDLLGVPAAEVELFLKWAEVIPSLTRSTAAEIQQAADEMKRYLLGWLDAKRTEPGDDLLTALVIAEDAGELTERETLNLARLMYFAGQDSPTNLMTRGTLVLLNSPDQLDTLRRDPSLIDRAVEEILRFSMVSGTGLTHPTVATEDVTLSGVVIRAGEVVVTPYIAANRDPAQFDDPDIFDITRHDARGHLAFGHGIHYCLGAPLARIQLRVWFRSLVEHFPTLRPAKRLNEPVWSPDLLPNRMKELVVTW
jgi:cytochrome P450